MSSVELCLIDSGLKSLMDLKLSPGLINLNVHSNKIARIENLLQLTVLKHLDLSSNDIKQISGLSKCTGLQTLNLSCNFIVKVEGIESLKLLRKMDISYNQINDISGFKSVSKSTHQLTHVDLYGNQLSSLKHVTQCLLQCNCLTHLSLLKGDDGNPVCGIAAYRPNMFSQLPWLKSLDGKDQYGQVVNKIPVSTHDIPGLDEYLAFLDPSSTSSSLLNFDDTSTSVANTQSDINTPRIDTVLQKFSKKNDSDAEQHETESVDTEIISSKQNEKEVSDRLESLENKLTSLVKMYSENKVMDDTNERKEVFVHFDTDSSSEVGQSTSDNQPPNRVLQKKHLKAHVRQHHGTEHQSKPFSKVTNEKQVKKGKGKENLQSRLAVDRTNVNKKESNIVRNIQSTSDDETFLSLLNEMDSERERRWKAEQASRKLLDNIKILHERLVEEKKIQEAAISSAAKLKKELNIEKEAHAKFEELAKKSEAEIDSMKLQQNVLMNDDEKRKCEIKAFEVTVQKLEKEKMEEGLFHEKRYKELQMETGGWNRELELLRNTVEKQKGQHIQLQELLVSREQEHKTALAGKVSVDSKEVRDICEQEIAKCEARHAELSKQTIYQLKNAKSDYAALEDEFRMALQIEANRFNELYTSHESNVDEFNQLKSAFEELSQKEAKSKSLLIELTALVKEQKTQINEINKCKCDMQLQYKERVSQLETEVVNLRKNTSKLDSLQQDKDRMAAHIRGQESIIQGLRSERKLWGQELAQQGASLAQERGKIDVQLESQQNEISSLQKQISDCNDSLKIKNKLVTDQTDTIRSMKEEILKLTEDKKRIVDDLKEEIEMLRNDLDRVKEQNSELDETVSALTDRKDELKFQLASVEDDLKQSKDEVKKLNGQWDERSKLIGQFEEKVVKMKSSFDEKEKKLIQERDVEIERANLAEEKIKQYEGRYKSEVATMKHDFNLELRKIIAQKDDEIHKGKEQVLKVEEEMRMVLTETNNQKKCLENKLSTLSKAFSDLKQDLT